MRLIPLEAIHNFRDLGGYNAADGLTTRWHTLYRSDALFRATPADVAVITELGIRTIVDLRTVQELNDRGSLPADLSNYNFHHIPVIDLTWVESDRPTFERDVDFLVDAYRDMIRLGQHRFAESMTLLAGPDALPAVFHCAAGKDRTGLLAAFVLGTVGVADDDIVADYALTQHAVERMRQWAAREDTTLLERMAQAPKAMMAALPDAMRIILDELRSRHGSIIDFVQSIGVTDATVATLRDALLESAPSAQPRVEHVQVGR